MPCFSCHHPQKQVLLKGTILKTKTETDILAALARCTPNRPLHVVKRQQHDDFCYVHFHNETHAATFYLFYAKQRRTVCEQLPTIIVRPALLPNKQPVAYDMTNVQTTLDRNSLCACQTTRATSSKQPTTPTPSTNECHVGDENDVALETQHHGEPDILPTELYDVDESETTRATSSKQPTTPTPSTNECHVGDENDVALETQHLGEPGILPTELYDVDESETP
ncbi:hypothetical protein DM01DRAFT_1406958, partial [Hesseltinella vesiculosa]